LESIAACPSQESFVTLDGVTALFHTPLAVRAPQRGTASALSTGHRTGPGKLDMSWRHTVLAGLLLISACGVKAGNQREGHPNYAASRNPHIRLFAWFWKQARWENRRIHVCWENAAPEHAAATALVRQSVEQTWQKESALQFFGWDACPARSAGIRIRIEDSGPHTLGLGKALARVSRGMTLNFTFQNWSPSCAAEREYCIKSIAVHVFGHAIGFAQEQNRPNAPGECRLLKQGPDGDLMMTPYDKSSVMNYCNPKYNNDGALSALDIQAVREVYGAPANPTPAN
jgi:hypothetical protein